MNTKLVVSIVGLALVAGLFFFAFSGERDGRPRGSGVEHATEQPSEPAPSMQAAAPVPEAAPSAVARELARPMIEAATPTSWRGELAGLTGRVVESDGTPVAGIRVALLEVDSMLLFDGSALDEEEPTLEIEETLTNSEGRFVLGGARSRAFHGLGIDLAGPRATLRILDHALPHRERTDIGDVVLAPYGILTGRVVDEQGAPVAGARVRAGPFPEEVLSVNPFEFRSGTLISVNQATMGGDGLAVVELPGWVHRALERLPVPTTESGPDGNFRLEGVALAQVVGGIDKREYVGIPIGPIDMSEGDQDLGELVLKRGRTIQGVVEDMFGEPAVGIEVFAGAELLPGVVAFLQPCGKTDEDGNFELTGVAEEGQVVAASRRAAHEPWGTAVTANHQNVLVEIEATVQLAVRVVGEQGQPLSGARIQLHPGRRSGSGMNFTEVLSILPKPPTPRDLFREVEEGRYVVESVTAGSYDITVRIAGRAPGHLRTECTAEVNEVTVVCTTGSMLELTVVDAISKAPVEGARASILRIGASGFNKLALERSGEDGILRIGPLPDPSAEEALTSFMPAETMLHVQHPRYGDHAAKLESIPPSLVVELEAGGILAGRVHWGGAIPSRFYMVTLEFRGADGFLESFHLPRFGLTGLEGEFRMSSLPAGKYKVALMERFLNQDPFGMMNDEFSVPTLHKEEIEIRNGETTELVIDLSPTGRGALASVVGHIRLDGRNLEGAEVSVRGNENVSVLTDEGGRFETPEFSVRGSARVSIEGDVRLADGRTRRMQLHQESVELEHGDVHEVNLDLYPLKLNVQVVDGVLRQPVAEADVSVRPKKQQRSGFRDSSKTNSAGEVELLVLQPGEYVLSASASGFAKGSSKVEVAEAGIPETAVVELPRAVPCIGRVVIDTPPPGGEAKGFAYVWVQGEENGSTDGTRISSPDYEFELDGLSPGKYKAWIYIGGEQGEQRTFELGPEGADDLILSYVASEE